MTPPSTCSANVTRGMQGDYRRDLWRVAQRKLKALDVAARLDDLRIPAGNRLERLQGARSTQHSIRINAQYRITFRWENGHAYEAKIEDYH